MSEITYWLRAGTVSVQAGSNVVTGVSTYWKNAVQRPTVGDAFSLDGQRWFEISAVEADGKLKVIGTFAATVNNSSYMIKPVVSASPALRLQAQITEILAQNRDFFMQLNKFWYDPGEVTVVDPFGNTHTHKTLYTLKQTIDTYAFHLASLIETGENSVEMFEGLQQSVEALRVSVLSLQAGVNASLQTAQTHAVTAQNAAASATASSLQASAHRDLAAATANFKGLYSALTGALNIPASVYHNGMYWTLLSSLANVTTAVPGASASWAVATGESYQRQMQKNFAKSVLALDFANNRHRLYGEFGLAETTLATALTTVRSGTANYNSPMGLKTAAANSPRIEYDPATGEARGLLCEAQSTNLFTHSQNFTETETNWLDVRSTTTPAAGIAPDGTNTATLFTESAEPGGSYLYKTSFPFTAGITYTVSCYIKAYGAGTGMLNLALPVINGFSSSQTFAFNPSTGVIIGAASGYTAKMTKDVNGWWRCSLTALCQTTTTANYVAINIIGAVAPDLATNQYLLWGAQLEASFGPTSYIPTAAAVVTRVAAQYVRAIADLVNKVGSTFIIDARTDATFNANVNGFFGIGSGGATNALSLSHAMSSGNQLIRARWYAGGTQIEVTGAVMSAPVNQTNRALLTFHENGTFALAVNGVDYGSAVSDAPNTAAWVEYWLGSLRTKTDTLIQQATISQFRVLPRFISSAAERAELSAQ